MKIEHLVLLGIGLLAIGGGVAFLGKPTPIKTEKVIPKQYTDVPEGYTSTVVNGKVVIADPTGKVVQTVTFPEKLEPHPSEQLEELHTQPLFADINYDRRFMDANVATLQMWASGQNIPGDWDTATAVQLAQTKLSIIQRTGG